MSDTLKYGLITGLGICGWMLLEHALGFHTTRFAAGEYSTYFSSLIPFGALYVMLRQRQQLANGRPLPLGPSVLAGIAVSVVTALIVYSFLIFYNQLLNPGWIDAALEWKVGQWRMQGMSEPAIREQILVFRHLNSPRGLLLSLGAGMPVMGAILAYGITLFLRRSPHPRRPAAG
jgi:Protein of unknown function (DUF4199)